MPASVSRVCLPVKFSILFVFFLVFALFLKIDNASAGWVCDKGIQCIGGRDTCASDVRDDRYQCYNINNCSGFPGFCLGECCRNVPDPPSPTPAPTCIQPPGSFASYDGCVSCDYDRVNYYNCDGSTFSVTSPNPDCSYLCPTPPPD